MSSEAYCDQQTGEEDEKFQSFFVEHEQALNLVTNLGDASIDENKIESIVAEFIKILEKYQEHATLLDPHLQQMIDSVMTILRSVIFSTEEQKKQNYPDDKTYKTFRQALFKVLYTITRVRGAKTILKHFPHEIYELEPLFSIYLSIPETEEWETRYIVLLWLSLIIMNPFDISIVDSSSIQKTDQNKKERLADQMINEAKKCLSEPGKVREGRFTVFGQTTHKST
ncbi:tubulin-specific chaperone D [Acrasis kona]|uniref:Tubulin-specific chaperone D n=1 Tax=Acrasis kona TaxID=1008807 RepID=A0AAW2YTN0_9EUKA